jgi:hypothetical protein
MCLGFKIKDFHCLWTVTSTQRLALPAGGWGEMTPFCRSQLLARNVPENAATPTRRVHAVLGIIVYEFGLYLWGSHSGRDAKYPHERLHSSENNMEALEPSVDPGDP